jgi:excisionase family DNA binding protein
VTLRGNWNGEGNVDWTGDASHSCPPRLSDTTQEEAISSRQGIYGSLSARIDPMPRALPIPGATQIEVGSVRLHTGTIKTTFLVPERPSRFLLIRGCLDEQREDARRRGCGRCSELIYFMERTRITVEEIASRLQLGRLAVYALLESGEIPAIRLGRRWIITRFSYETWEHNCGVSGVRFDHGHTQAQV